MLANKNKKGFTLIELLAVIVILAVIALIATPLVLKYIETARKESARISTLSYVDSIEKEVAYGQLKNKIYKDKEDYYLNEIPVSVKGSAPSGAIYSLKKGTVESGKFCINGYEVVYSPEETTVTGTCNGEDMKLPGGITISEPNSYGYFTHPATKTIEILENVSKGTLSCTSSDISIATCSISGNLVTITTEGGEGKANITIFSQGNGKYDDATFVYVVTTEKGVLTVNANGYDGVYDGKPHGITVTASESIIKYGTSEGTYDLTESPKYTDVGEYTVYYEVTSAGYKTAYGSKVVKITKAEGKLLLESNSGTVEYDKTKEIEIKENASNGEITVSVAHSDIAEASIVDNKLVVKGKSTGITTVTLKVEETKNYTSTSIEYNVEVIKANNTLTLSSSYGTYTYPNGGTFTITENKSGGSLSCESSDTNVATCTISDNTVTVTLGTTKGTATLTIKSSETPNYNAGKAAYVVTTEAGALSVNANGYEGVYDGKEYGITVTVSEATITYGTTLGTYNLTESPKYTNVGEYEVFYKVEKAGYNVSYGSEIVKITKAAGSVTAPTASTLTYNESAQALISAGSSTTGTIEYSLDGTNYSTTIPTATNPGTYTVYYRVVGDNNHFDVEAKSLDVTIIKATLQYTSAGYTGVYDELAHGITVTSPNGTIMYGDSSTNVTSLENITYTNVGEYTVFFKITRPGYVDVTGSEIVKITKADNELVLSDTVGTYTYPTAGTFTIDKNKSGGALSCESDNEATATCSISGNVVTVTLGTTKGTATLTIKSAETQNYKAAQVAFVATTEAGALSVNAYDYTGVYDGKEHSITVSVTNGDATITYGTTSTNVTDPNNPKYTDVGDYTVYYQVSLAGYNTVTGSKMVKITKADGTVSAPTAKTNLTYSGSNQALISAGSSTTGTIQYKLEGGTYSGSIPTGKNAGDYTVYYKVVGDKNHFDVAEKSFTVTINKADGTVSAPTTKTNLTYTGSAQALISAGSSTTGTIQYKVGTGSYSTSVPTKTAAGTYTVYYRVVGDSNHNDVAAKSFTVTIAQASNTVTLSKTTGTITYPNSVTIDVTSTVSGTISCSSNKTSVATCSVNNSAKTVTITAGPTAGTANITVTVAPSDTNYKSGQAVYVATGQLGTLSVTANGYTGTYDGTAHGITVTSSTSGATIKYGTSSGSYTLTSSPTYTNPGTYTVYYQVTLTGYTTVTGSKTVVIDSLSASNVYYNNSTYTNGEDKTIQETLEELYNLYN